MLLGFLLRQRNSLFHWHRTSFLPGNIEGGFVVEGSASSGNLRVYRLPILSGSTSYVLRSPSARHEEFANNIVARQNPIPKRPAKGFDAVKINDAQHVLTYLATQYDGRGTGQPG